MRIRTANQRQNWILEDERTEIVLFYCPCSTTSISTRSIWLNNRRRTYRKDLGRIDPGADHF